MSPTRRICLGLFLVLFFIYGSVHQRDYRAATPVSRLDLLHSLFTHGMLQIDFYNNTGDRAVYQGHYYSDKAPGGVFVALPAFAAATGLARLAGLDIESERGWLFTSWFASAFSMGLLTALGGVFLFLTLRRWVTDSAAMLTVLAIYLGAAPFPYATQMFTHGMVVGSICMVLYYLHFTPHGNDAAPSDRDVTIAGLWAGLALASEYTAGLILYGIGLFVLARNWKQGIRFGLAAAAPLCLVPLYSWLCFANPFVIGYSHQSTYQTMKQGLFGIREPNCKTMIDLTLGPCRGLFFWSPFLLMAIPGYNHVYPRNRNAFWLIFLAPLVQLFVLSGYFDWKAGFTLGPRYLAPALPLLAVPAALGTQAFPRTAAVLGGLSILLTGGATLITAAPQYDSNPLLTQHWPRLLRGEFCYTLGWTLGLPAGVGVVASVICWELSLIWLWRQVQLGRAGEP